MNLSKQTWITLIKMTAEMDAGPILDIEKFDIPFERNSLDIIEKMKQVGPKFLTKTLKNYPKWLVWLTKQDISQITFCKKIEKEQWEIDITSTFLYDVYQKYRAFFLWPKIFFIRKNKRFIIEYLKIDKELFWQNSSFTLVDENFDLNVAVLDIIIKPENWKKMDRKSWKNGNI